MSYETSGTAKGVLGGLGTGASIGSSILPGIGTGVGAVIGAVVGGISGNSKGKAMDEALNELNLIPPVDPNMVAFKDQLFREKKAVESGFTTDFQVARDIIGQSQAGGMSVAAEMALTNPALALLTMGQVTQGADASINKALGTIGTRSMGYTAQIGDLVDKISQRELQVGMMKVTQGMGMATKELSDSNANAGVGLMKLGNLTDMAKFDWGSLFKSSGGVVDAAGGTGVGNTIVNTGANSIGIPIT
jgi:hypothetical protein